MENKIKHWLRKIFTKKQYKLVARHGEHFFVHKTFDTYKEAKALLDVLQADRDCTIRKWKFWIHEG